MTMRSTLALLLVLLLLSEGECTRDAISPAEFRKYWSDPAQIVQNLDDYQALWIKVHNCV